MNSPLPCGRRLVLASTSEYRRQLLERLELPFVTAKPETDESPLPNESPLETALRLAEAKARAVAGDFPQALIIGSDQVACIGNRIFGKPGNHERAVAQLQALSGQTVVFHTALCLLDSGSGQVQVRNVPTEARFRPLANDEIERYLRREQPYNCAGSAKSEGLGIALLDYMRGDDPNALVGLPLIALCDMLRQVGVAVP